MPTTTLLLGGRIHSPTAPDATAMAVAGDTIVWIGQDEPGRALHGHADHVIDLHGAFVAPAFVDAHVHATATGLLLDGLDLTDCTSLAQCLHAVATHVRTHPGQLVWGHGWDPTRWPEQRPPTRDELDTVAGTTPVYLSRIDVHSAVISSALLARTPAAATATGYSDQGPLTQDAHHQVRRAARDALHPDQRRHAQLAFLRHAATHGIAAVHECAGPDISGADDLAALLDLATDPDLPEVVGYWGEIGALDTATRLGARGLAGDLFVDGSLGSHTAALTQPYTDQPTTCGAQYLNADDIADHLIACTRAGLQAGFHVIGDAATAAVLDGLRRAETHLGLPALASAGHRLEHLEMITPEQAADLARFGVLASVQPGFDATWGGPEGMYAHRLGPARAAGLNPFAALAAAGVSLALGSDTPVTPVGPWETIRAAVHHHTPGSGLSARAAFTAHTRGGWRAAGHHDGLAGTLVPGAPATYAIWDAPDLVVTAPDSRVQRWSTDPRSRVPGLPDLTPGQPTPTCLRTVLRGQPIFQREGALTP